MRDKGIRDQESRTPTSCPNVSIGHPPSRWGFLADGALDSRVRGNPVPSAKRRTPHCTDAVDARLARRNAAEARWASV